MLSDGDHMSIPRRFALWLAIVIVAGLFAAAAFGQLSPIVPDPRCDPSDLPLAYSNHAAHLRSWLFQGSIVMAAAALVIVITFLYLQITHGLPAPFAIGLNVFVVAGIVSAAGFITLQTARGWVESNAGSCLTETLASEQANSSSFVGSVTHFPEWQAGIFVDAAILCLIGICVGSLFYLTVRRVARA
jgi:hypothetical protein